MSRSVVRILLAVTVTLVAAPAAGANPEPDWYAREAANALHAMGRGIDHQTNPEYASRFAPMFAEWIRAGATGTRVMTDPFRLDWAPGRGEEVAISYRNRYGARIVGHVLHPKLPFTDPVTGQTTSGPLPAVILVNGHSAPAEPYRGMAQGLAEAGYLVMTFDPQGQGNSDVRPAEAYCDPEGSWREPQEMGLREQGECAGMDPPLPGFGTPLDPTPVGWVPWYLDMLANGVDYEAIDRSYQLFRPRFVFGALDAVAWLLSDANPKRHLVDEGRVAVAGHSAGADGALLAANGDPLGRFAAAVSWDGYGQMPANVEPTVPTMFQHADQEDIGHIRPPDPDEQPGAVSAQRFRDADVDTMKIVLAGSTHQEWGYIPYPLINPFCGGDPRVCNASQKGERVALYYTVAWLDRYLKGSDDTAQAQDARARLAARTFDGSIDASSIGVGAWDPLRGNIGHTIAGERVTDHLSFHFRSLYDFDGRVCEDARQGCS